MNGAHDMGGMAGLGELPLQDDEPVFHARWEARVLALTLAAGAWGKWNIDRSRHARERIPGPDYLAMPYYGKWCAGLVRLLLEEGMVSAAELASGRPDPSAAVATPRFTADRVAAALRRGGPTIRPLDCQPRFELGEAVRARNINPEGHTRLPRYVRGHAGVIERLHGAHVFPDDNAHGRGENPQPLYTVRFAARDLWGPSAGPNDSVRLDLWEDYLEPA